MLHAQCFEQLGQDDTAHGVHTVDGYVEVSLADSLYIHQVESQHAINMLLVISQVFAVSSKFVNFGVFESSASAMRSTSLPSSLFRNSPFSFNSFRAFH